MCRFSVNVFQPPFQSGRTSPETSQSRVDLPPVPAGSPDGPGLEDEAVGGSSTVGAGNLELESHASLPESQAEYAQASAIHSGDSESLSSSQTSLSTTRTTDSGFSESLSSASCCFLDPHAEKETSCEKAVRPEGKCIVQILHYFGDLPFFFFFLAFLFKLLERSAAAVAGYQHPCESASGHASQFYIALLDANNKEQRLDERGTTPLSTQLIFFSFILLIAIFG